MHPTPEVNVIAMDGSIKKNNMIMICFNSDFYVVPPPHTRRDNMAAEERGLKGTDVVCLSIIISLHFFPSAATLTLL